MKKPNEPIIDQKVITEKKGNGWIWIIVVLVILALLWWFFSSRNHDDNQENTAQVAQPAVVESNAAASEPVATAADTNQMSALQQLQNYYADTNLPDSQAINLNSIDFASESATPTVNDNAEISSIVSLLNEHPNSTVLLRGFTDATGPDSINDPLSAQRAEAVKKLFTDGGVDAGRINIDGAGDAQQVASNQSAEGRNMNRRVTMRVQGH